ncbi:MAG: DNA polymerase I [Candidatus Omnitrophota bacterium]
MPNGKLYLIDATAFCYRAFYALKSLSTSSGEPTNAVYGFLNMFNKVVKDHKPDYIAACFDVSRDTFRSKKFAEYKVQRPPMPDGLGSQMAVIKEILGAYGVAVLEKQGFEADDIIAYFAHKAAESKLQVVIVSSDKDMLQLVGKHIGVFNPYKDGGVVYDDAKVKEEFGVEPNQIADLIALMGDSADNIPGVNGVGPKTAVKLISEFGSLDKLLQHIDKVAPEKVRQSISGDIQKVKLNKELVHLGADLDMDFDPEQLRAGDADTEKLAVLFKRLEFKRFLKSLPGQKPPCSQDVNLCACSGQEIMPLLAKEGELAVCGETKDSLVFAAGGKFCKLTDSADQLKELLADSKVRKVGHDLKKLKVSLAKENLLLDGLYFDTMLAAYLLNPSKPGYQLEDVSFDFLGGQFLGAGQVNPAACAEAVLKLKPLLEGQLKEKGVYELFRTLEMPLAGVLASMEEAGIKIDLKLLAKLSKDISARLVKLIAQIYEVSGTEFNINSPKQLGEVLFGKLKLPVIKRTKTGPSTNEDVLRQLSQKHKLPELLLEYRQLTKLKSTYIDALPLLVDEHSGRVHTSFNQTGTETGRLSSSNPNLQNIPIKTDIGKHIRRAIVASDKKHCLVSCDYSQIELRILAHLSADETLIEAFHKGEDIHRATAALIYETPEERVEDKMREIAKRVNFGILYGQTAFGLGKDLAISVNQAQDFIDAYFLRYPKVRAYVDQQVKNAEDNGFVTTLLGRRRYIPEIRSKNQSLRLFAQRQAVNTPIQGSASDLIKLAMVKIAGQLKDNGLKARMILQIHDELVFELPNTELDALVKIAKECMEHVLELKVPVRVDIKKGDNWLEMEPIL